MNLCLIINSYNISHIICCSMSSSSFCMFLSLSLLYYVSTSALPSSSNSLSFCLIYNFHIYLRLWASCVWYLASCRYFSFVYPSIFTVSPRVLHCPLPHPLTPFCVPLLLLCIHVSPLILSPSPPFNLAFSLPPSPSLLLLILNLTWLPSHIPFVFALFFLLPTPFSSTHLYIYLSFPHFFLHSSSYYLITLLTKSLTTYL